MAGGPSCSRIWPAVEATARSSVASGPSTQRGLVSRFLTGHTSSLCGYILQVLDDRSSLFLVGDSKCHVAVRYEPIRVRQPFIERAAVPCNTRLSERFRVRERWNGCRRSPKHAAKARAHLVVIQGMTSRAPFFEELLALAVTGD